MKSVVSVIAVCLLAGCAGGGAYIKQIPIVESNGSKSYVLTNPSVIQRKDYALQEMKERADSLCPSGYDRLNEEIYRVAMSAAHTPHHSIEVVWQIRCKTT